MIGCAIPAMHIYPGRNSLRWNHTGRNKHVKWLCCYFKVSGLKLFYFSYENDSTQYLRKYPIADELSAFLCL